MTDVAGASGAAYDAYVSTDPVAPHRYHDPVAAAQANVAAAQAKVDRQRGHLAAAEQRLVDARAELDVAQGA